ncbi:MAG: twin-arginine translocation signal domain-containing protein [Acidobacteria bacterium]|nr:twin-arginine translocation signal domain-containing protein [Acidobacteriota bacterium]
MGFDDIGEKGTTRRGFVRNIAAGAGGLAIASALQEALTSGQSGLMAAPSQSQSPGGKKYGKFFLSDKGEQPKEMDFVGLNSIPPFPEIASPQTYFRGASALPGATATIGWQVFIAPVCWETPHIHKYDEFLIFLGGELPDLCGSFDAEIDLWMGEEMEKHTITSTTVVYIPKGMQHAPLNFRVIRKPVLFHALYLGPSLDREPRVPGFDLTTFDWGGPANLKTFGPPKKK